LRLLLVLLLLLLLGGLFGLLSGVDAISQESGADESEAHVDEVE
jgi:hypothetical protein